MTALIISLPNTRADVRKHNDNVGARPDDQFEVYVSCLMTTTYALSSSLLAPALEPLERYLAKFVDDPALLTKIATHRERNKLSKLMLGIVMAESASSCLWNEIEELISQTSEGMSRPSE